jgi:hypothetical protein
MKSETEVQQPGFIATSEFPAGREGGDEACKVHDIGCSSVLTCI